MPSIQNIKNRASSEESGFSLIELLVVVLIIGILAAVMIPRFLSQRDSAKNSQAISNIREAETALNTYFNLNNESFGASAETLATAMQGASSGTAGGREKGLVWAYNTGTSPTDLAASGTGNNPKEIILYAPETGRFGGVGFCVASTGTKNYCAMILGNAATLYWTISGQDNSLSTIPTVNPGNPGKDAAALTLPIAFTGSRSNGWSS